ncbi:MAG: AbrB/MazE/SpoVT family DNA-binding domain-containing protein [bacterium]
MPVVTISSKGQLVIPAKIRKALGIESNSKVRVTLSEDKTMLLIEPLPDNPIEALTGIFENHSSSLANELLQERKKDLGHEET